MGTGSFPEGRGGRGMGLTPHPIYCRGPRKSRVNERWQNSLLVGRTDIQRRSTSLKMAYLVHGTRYAMRSIPNWPCGDHHACFPTTSFLVRLLALKSCFIFEEIYGENEIMENVFRNINIFHAKFSPYYPAILQFKVFVKWTIEKWHQNVMECCISYKQNWHSGGRRVVDILFELVRRWADKFCFHCNIFIYFRHIWIKPVLCSRMVSLFHHTSPWTPRCLQSSPSVHRNGRVFRRSVRTARCYWILNRGKSSSNWNSQTNAGPLWWSVCWCEYSKMLSKVKSAARKWFQKQNTNFFLKADFRN